MTSFADNVTITPTRWRGIGIGDFEPMSAHSFPSSREPSCMMPGNPPYLLPVTDTDPRGYKVYLDNVKAPDHVISEKLTFSPKQ